MKLRDSLEDFYKNHLVKLAALVPVQPKRATKDGLIDAIVEALNSPWLETLILEHLGPLERLAVAHLAHNQWETYSDMRFMAMHGTFPTFGYETYWGFVVEPLDLLIHEMILPSDLKPRLQKLLPAPEPFVFDTSPPELFREGQLQHVSGETKRLNVAAHVQNAEQLAPQELHRLLNAIQQRTLKWTIKSRVPTKTTRQIIEEHVLLSPEFLAEDDQWSTVKSHLRWPNTKSTQLRTNAWATLLYHTKYIKFQNHAATLTRLATTALKKPTHEMLKDLWTRWLKQKTHDAIWDVPSVKGTNIRRASLQPVIERRQQLVEGLKQCPVNQWIDIKHWKSMLIMTDRYPTVTTAKSTIEINNEEIVPDLDYAHLLIGWLYTSSFLVRYAATLGIVDIAYTPPVTPTYEDYIQTFWNHDNYLSLTDGLLAIRLTELGAYILGLTDTYTPPTREIETTLKVLDNGDIVCLTPPDHFTQAMLDTYANDTGENTWNLHTTSILAAINAGEPLQTLLDFLDHLPEDIPATVQVMLNDIVRKQEAFDNLGHHVVLHFKDPILVKEIAHHQGTKKYCTAAGPNHLLVQTAQLDKFRKAIQKLGYALPTST